MTADQFTTDWVVALAALDRERSALAAAVARLDAGRPDDLLPVIRATAAVQEAIDQIGRLLAAVDGLAGWANRAELESVGATLAERLRAADRRAERLADIIASGWVVNRSHGRRRTAYDKLIEDAAAQLRTAAGVTVPGPEPDEWLAWVWADPQRSADPALSPLFTAAPKLAELIGEVDAVEWRVAAPAVVSPPPSPLPPPPVAQPVKPSAGRITSETLKTKQLLAFPRPQSKPVLPPPPAAEPPPILVASPPPPAAMPPPAAVPPPPVIVPSQLPPPPTAVPPPPPPVSLASAEQIADHCRREDYLGAALLAAGRAAAGRPADGFLVEVLVVAHHVWQGADSVPWPAWLDDATAVEWVRGEAVESARLLAAAVLLAGYRPTGGQALPELLKAYNGYPHVRTWLSRIDDAQAIPGVWGWLRRNPGDDPKTAYRAAAKSFRDLRDNSLITQNGGRAFTSRLNYWVSRRPAVAELYDLLPASAPAAKLGGRLTALAEEFLALTGRRLTDRWQDEHPKANLKKGDLEHRQVKAADEYLGVVRAAVQAGRVLLHSAGPPPELDRHKGLLTQGRAAAEEQAAGHTWGAIVRRLAEGIR